MYLKDFEYCIVHLNTELHTGILEAVNRPFDFNNPYLLRYSDLYAP